ncbi:L,D-transpeptidase [Propionibacterium sp.]|uniref:L,D-transpeptidase n=1 Tax=Propionibacterium sp. TaxID=1977903 RepID=UPI0039ECA990
MPPQPVPKAVYMRRRSVALFGLLAAIAIIVAAISVPVHIHSKSAAKAHAAALAQCQSDESSFNTTLAQLHDASGQGQQGSAAGTGDPGTIADLKSLYSSTEEHKPAACSQSASTDALHQSSTGYTDATSAMQAKIDGAKKGSCVSSDQASAAPSASASPSSGASCEAKKDTTVDQTLDWVSPSGGTQPDLSKVPDLHIHVSLEDQRVYVMSGSKVIYTMICSSGVGDDTPTGDYQVQNRGTTFYNGSEGMGANYWVSWKDWGVFLFHSVPIDQNGQYIESEAQKLGNKASNGCVRLTVDDAKWFYEQLPENTPVHVD